MTETRKVQLVILLFASVALILAALRDLAGVRW